MIELTAKSAERAVDGPLTRPCDPERIRALITPGQRPWLLLCLINGVFITAAILVLLQSREQYSDKATTEAEALSAALAQTMLAMIDKIDLALLVTLDEIERQSASGGIDGPTLERFLARSDRRLPESLGLAVFSQAGIVEYSVNSGNTKGVSAEDRPYFTTLRDNPAAGLVLSPPYIGHTTRQWIMVLARRRNHPDGSFAGAVGARIPLSYLQNLVTSLDVGPHGVVSLYDGDQTILARNPLDGPQGNAIGQSTPSPVLKARIAAGQTMGHYLAHSGLDGILRLYYYREVGDLPLYVNVALAEQDYLLPWRQACNWTGALTLLFLLTSSAVTWHISRRNRERSQMVQDLAQQEEKFRTIADHSFFWEDWVSQDGQLLWVNPAVANLTGFSAAECLTMADYPRPLILPADWPQVERMLSQARAGDVFQDVEIRQISRDGRNWWAGVSMQPVVDDQGRPAGHRGTIRDITERKKFQLALKNSEIRYRTAFDSNVDAVIIKRLSDGIVVEVNQSFTDITEFTAAEVHGRTLPSLNLWAQSRDREAFLNALNQNRNVRNMKVQLRKKSGGLIWGLMSAWLVEIDDVPCILSVTRDISDLKMAEDEARTLAFFDPLTNLPNRRLLLDRLQHAITACQRNSSKGGLLFVDIDNFKTLNDTRGHEKGDLLLQEIAHRLAACVRANDTVARLGGDEFVIVLEDLDDNPGDAATQARLVADKVLSAVAAPFALCGHEIDVSVSIGVTIIDGSLRQAGDVIIEADIAMYQAKQSGRNTVRFFSPALQALAKHRASIEDELKKAIRNDQFFLAYQPQIEAGRVIGCEALIRWQNPSRGLVPPGEFIPIAEETGLILPIGQWVLQTACAQIAAWTADQSTRDIMLSVNVSARQFRQPGFVDDVLSALGKSGADAKNLKLELTETMLVDNVEDVSDKMNALKAHGLSFSLDDFGTGYSSLSSLKRLPFDQIKIDQSFIQDLPDDQESAVIVVTILALSQAMGLSAIAEGVETAEQSDFLAGLGCSAMQGYLHSRPLPPQDFEALLRVTNGARP